MADMGVEVPCTSVCGIDRFTDDFVGIVVAVSVTVDDLISSPDIVFSLVGIVVAVVEEKGVRVFVDGRTVLVVSTIVGDRVVLEGGDAIVGVLRPVVLTEEFAN